MKFFGIAVLFAATLLAASLSLVAPAAAWGIGLHPDGWYKVNVEGYSFWMPPKVCTVGYIAKHRVLYKPQRWMDSHFHSAPGLHIFGELVIDSYGSTIYISTGIPPRVQAMNLVHEEANLRGCGDDPVDRQYTRRG